MKQLGLIFLCTLISCTTETPMKSGIVIRTQEKPINIETIDENLPPEDLQGNNDVLENWKVHVKATHPDFLALVYDTLIQNAKSVQSESDIENNFDINSNVITVRTVATEHPTIFKELQNRLYRYAEMEQKEKNIHVTEIETSLPADGTHYVFTLVEDESVYDKILSTFRRSKWYIISEWVGTGAFAFTAWTSVSAKEVAKLLTAKFSNSEIIQKEHRILLRRKGTSIKFLLDNHNVENEIQMAITTRLMDMDIRYEIVGSAMTIWPDNFDGSITELIKKILREDEILNTITVKLDKKTKTITVLPKKTSDR